MSQSSWPGKSWIQVQVSRVVVLETSEYPLSPEKIREAELVALRYALHQEAGNSEILSGGSWSAFWIGEKNEREVDPE